MFDQSELLMPILPPFLYREELTILAGGAYAGKSRLLLHTANALALGEPCFLGQLPAPINVLYCSERSTKFNHNQMLTIGMTSVPPNLYTFSVPDVHSIALFERNPLAFLGALLDKAHFTPSLAIFDTVFHFQARPEGKGDTVNSYSFNKLDLMHLKQWATQHELAVLGAAHSPKQSEKNNYPDPFDRILGSTAILASTVAVFIAERQDDNVMKLHQKSHVKNVESPRYFSYEDFHEIEKPLSAPTPTEASILKLSPTEPAPRTETLQALGVMSQKPDNQIRNIVNALIAKGYVEEIIIDGVRYIRRVKDSVH